MCQKIVILGRTVKVWPAVGGQETNKYLLTILAPESLATICVSVSMVSTPT